MYMYMCMYVYVYVYVYVHECHSTYTPSSNTYKSMTKVYIVYTVTIYSRTDNVGISTNKHTSTSDVDIVCWFGSVTVLSTNRTVSLCD